MIYKKYEKFIYNKKKILKYKIRVKKKAKVKLWLFIDVYKAQISLFTIFKQLYKTLFNLDLYDIQIFIKFN